MIFYNNKTDFLIFALDKSIKIHNQNNDYYEKITNTVCCYNRFCFYLQ